MDLHKLEFVQELVINLQELVLDQSLGEFNITTFNETVSIICSVEDSAVIAEMLGEANYDFVERNNGDFFGNMKLMIDMSQEEN